MPLGMKRVLVEDTERVVPEAGSPRSVAASTNGIVIVLAQGGGVHDRQGYILHNNGLSRHHDTYTLSRKGLLEKVPSGRPVNAAPDTLLRGHARHHWVQEPAVLAPPP